MQVFTIGSGRNGTKSMAIILRTVFRNSFHEYNQLVGERRKTYADRNFYGPKLRSKVAKYRRMGEFHDSDNCNAMFMQHLCKEFSEAKVLLPIGSPRSFIRAHRVWGIMGPKDKYVSTRAYPPNKPQWKNWPIVVKLAWLWGKRNLEAVKRSDRSRLLVFRTKDISQKLPIVFKFIGKPPNKRAVALSKTHHNRLLWPADEVATAEREIDQNIVRIEEIISSFKNAITKLHPGVF